MTEGPGPGMVDPRSATPLEKGKTEGKATEKKSFKDVLKSRPDNKDKDTEMGGVGPERRKVRQIRQKQKRQEKGQKQQSHLQNGCLPKTTENLTYEVTSHGIGNYIQHMKYHTLIGKFMGIWPSRNLSCFGSRLDGR
jgi:hypothetical protein